MVSQPLPLTLQTRVLGYVSDHQKPCRLVKPILTFVIMPVPLFAPVLKSCPVPNMTITGGVVSGMSAACCAASAAAEAGGAEVPVDVLLVVLVLKSDDSAAAALLH